MSNMGNFQSAVCVDETPILPPRLRVKSMRKLLRIFPLLLVLAGIVLLFEQPAYAYTDPGTGLLAVQAVGSVLIATGWYLRRKISSLMHWGTSTKAAPERSAAAEEDKGSTLR
jgi:hypothetical protein